MLTKTNNGFSLGGFEARTGQKVGAYNITDGELAVSLYILDGLTQQQAADEMHCSKGNVNQQFQTLFYKLRKNKAIAAINELRNLGIIKHLMICFLILSSVISGSTSVNKDQLRNSRQIVRVRTRHQDDVARLV